MLKWALRFFLFGMAFLVIPLIAQADRNISSAKAGLIDQIIKATQGEKAMEQNVELLLTEKGKAIIMQLAQEGANAVTAGTSQNAQNNAYDQKMQKLQKFHDLVKRKISIPELTQKVSYPLYDKYFTEAELREIMRFHQPPQSQAGFKQSAVGKKYMQSANQFDYDYKMKIIEFVDPVIHDCLKQVGL